MAKVTSATFAERLLRSAEQAVAIKRGEKGAPRIVRRKVTARTTSVEEAPHFEPARIAALRKGLDVSQPVFAEMIGVKPVTVKAWERGLKEPSGTARRLLQILETQPAVLLQAARLTEAGAPARQPAAKTR